MRLPFCHVPVVPVLGVLGAAVATVDDAANGALRDDAGDTKNNQNLRRGLADDEPWGNNTSEVGAGLIVGSGKDDDTCAPRLSGNTCESITWPTPKRQKQLRKLMSIRIEFL